jgi:hypothetical protein
MLLAVAMALAAGLAGCFAVTGRMALAADPSSRVGLPALVSRSRCTFTRFSAQPHRRPDRRGVANVGSVEVVLGLAAAAAIAARLSSPGP